MGGWRKFRSCLKSRLGVTVCLTLFLLPASAARLPAMPVSLQIVSSKISSPTNGHVLAAYDRETLDGGYFLDLEARNLAGDGVLGPLQSIIEWLTGSSIFDKLGASNVHSTFAFSTRLQLTGDPGATAVVSADASIDGYCLHEIGDPAIPSGDALSKAYANLAVDYLIPGGGTQPVGSRDVSTEKKHSDCHIYHDFEYKDLADAARQLPPWEMVVGDPFTSTIRVQGAFSIQSKGNIDSVWYLPSAGGALSFTHAAFNLDLGIVSVIDPPQPLPEAATLLLVCVGLTGLAGYGKRKLRKNN